LENPSQTGKIRSENPCKKYTQNPETNRKKRKKKEKKGEKKKSKKVKKMDIEADTH
jgi:hypothetical protein